MLYCPECGAELEPGDEFCINCGASLVNGADSVPIAKKPKKKFNPIPLIVILSVIAIMAAAAIVAFNRPEVKLIAAITQTSYDLKENPTYAKLAELTEKGSLSAEANLTEFLTDLQYLDDVDAKANAKIYYDSDNSRIIANAGASVSGMSALDATLWADGEYATIKSGAFLGKDAYTINLTPFYANPDIVPASKAFAKTISYTKDSAFLKLYHLAVKYGSLSQDKDDTETVYHLNIDAVAAEKILRDFYAWAKKDSSSKEFFENVDASSVYAFIDSIDSNFNLKLRFFTQKNNQITKFEMKTGDCFVSVRVDDPKEINLADFKVQTGDYNLEYDSKIDDSEDDFEAKISCISDGKEFAEMLIEWDKVSGDFEIKADNEKITPAMKLFINDDDAPDLPSGSKEISLYEASDVSKLSGAVSENVTALVDELGLFLPFSLDDMIGSTLTSVAESYKGFIGSGKKALSVKEITEIAQNAAEEKAAQKAQEIAESTAREISETAVSELEAKIDAKIAEIEKKNKTLSTSDIPITPDNSDNADDADKPANSNKDYKTSIPGTYEYNASGISGAIALGADGTYAMKLQYAFYILTDEGTYSVDESGNVAFNTKLNYKVSGKYDGGNSLQMIIAGFEPVTLTRK